MTINKKVSLWTITSLLVVGLLASYIHYRLMRTNEAEEFESLGHTVAPVIEAGLIHSMQTRDNRLLNDTLTNLENKETIGRILVLDRVGEVRAALDQRTIGTQLVPFEREQFAGHGAGKMLRINDDIYRWVQAVQNREQCWSCHDARNAYNGFIVVDFSVGNRRQMLAAQLWGESLVIVAAFGVAAMVLLFLAHRFLITWLRNVTGTMAAFKNGRSLLRIPVAGNDELDQLAGGFNDMADSIIASQKEREQYADELLRLADSSKLIMAAENSEYVHGTVCDVAVRKMNLAAARIIDVQHEGCGVAAIRPGAGKDIARDATFDAVALQYAAGLKDSTTGLSQPLVVNELNNSQNEAWAADAEKRGWRSLIVLPLVSSDRDLLNVLILFSEEPGYFTPKRERLFTIFANLASRAIENSALLKRVAEKNIKLEKYLGTVSRSREEWQLTFDSITDMISVHDPEHRILKANSAFAGYFGLEPRDVINKKCCELFKNLCDPMTVCPHLNALLENKVYSHELVDTASGRTFQISAYPNYNAEGEFVGSVHVARDVTEAKEKELRISMSERLAMLGEMASGFAHEINNPLAAIGGYAEAMLLKLNRDKIDRQLFEKYLGNISEEIKHCAQISSSMLSLVRKSPGKTAALEVNGVLKKTMELVGFQGRLRTVSLVTNYHPDRIMVCGDEGELRQVFLIIISNALDAMGGRGELRIGTAVQDDKIIVRISDTGPGIAPENLNRIFDSFFSTRKEQDGNGLGLAIASKIIRSHNGSIDAESRYGNGAVFTITLPQASGEACVPGARSAVSCAE